MRGKSTMIRRRELSIVGAYSYQASRGETKGIAPTKGGGAWNARGAIRGQNQRKKFTGHSTKGSMEKRGDKPSLYELTGKEVRGTCS